MVEPLLVLPSMKIILWSSLFVCVLFFLLQRMDHITDRFVPPLAPQAFCSAQGPRCLVEASYLVQSCNPTVTFSFTLKTHLVSRAPTS